MKAVYQALPLVVRRQSCESLATPTDRARRALRRSRRCPDAAIAAARSAYESGDYRWVAELAGHLVFADPSHREARELQADAFEQLGYQSESATFRNAT